MTANHTLTHRTVVDINGPRLVPACSCGWWSADGSHWRFERHVRKATEVQP